MRDIQMTHFQNKSHNKYRDYGQEESQKSEFKLIYPHLIPWNFWYSSQYFNETQRNSQSFITALHKTYRNVLVANEILILCMKPFL